MHRSRPWADGSIPLNERIELSLVHNLRKLPQCSSGTRRTTDVLEGEYDLDSLDDGLLCIIKSGAAVEADTVKGGIGAGRAAGVDSGRVRVIKRLRKNIVREVFVGRACLH